MPRSHGGFEGYGNGVPAIIRTRSGANIREFPMNYANVLGRTLVYGGGGYFRLIPGPLGRHLFRKSAYSMTYFHLHYFYTNQPLILGLSPVWRFKSYAGINGAANKLVKLLSTLDFVTLRDAVVLINWHKVRFFYIWLIMLNSSIKNSLTVSIGQSILHSDIAVGAVLWLV